MAQIFGFRPRGRPIDAIWLQVYFLELRFPNIVLPEDQVLGLPLMSAEVPKCSIEERTYPWFQPGYRLFKKEPEEESARIDFRKKFLSVTLPRDLPYGGGKPPNYHLGAEVYHPNFCARQLGCPQLIPLKSYRSCNWATSWRDLDDLEVHKDARCAINKINNSADALYPAWEPNSCSSANFDAWWKARFHGLPASITALKVLFEGWGSWTIYVEVDAKNFVVQTIKDVNAQVIEDPSLIENIGGQSVQAGEVIVTSVIAAGDLELSSGDEDNEIMAEQPAVEATPSARRKRKKTTPVRGSAAQPATSAESPPSPPTKSKRLRKRTMVEYVAMEESAAASTNTSGTDEELREPFEAVEQEKELEEVEEGRQEKAKEMEEEEIPAEVIAESIALAQRQQKNPRAELTSSELAFFKDIEAEHSAAVPASEERAEQSASEPMEQAELPVAVSEAGVEVVATVPDLVVEVPRSAGVQAMMTSPLKPPIFQRLR
ncbi:uncharacterized protein LOC109946780 [Prunus persica]|uniref:uncharacterized protein LOC109946780 n=1 Tax=Prunus persica TaxID=3760 RepID=UPI0009AB927D|nr:uncharacterized protein LOC109946780 [Prunus persica]